MQDMHLLVGGMSCRSCVREVTARLRDVRGVEMVVADASKNLVVLTGSMEAEDVMRAMSTSTFRARIITDRPSGTSDC